MEAAEASTTFRSALLNATPFNPTLSPLSSSISSSSRFQAIVAPFDRVAIQEPAGVVHGQLGEFQVVFPGSLRSQPVVFPVNQDKSLAVRLDLLDGLVGIPAQVLDASHGASL
mmetsp:Transcript_3911/g.11092  ORF Transcript_3911/g.11092 Transcript_3911/m.11092 type:complete len:113 (-) Transcript_3911:1821-2159(-)